MKALIVNSSDTVGGAARAAFRLHQGLREKALQGRGTPEKEQTATCAQLSVQMLVQTKQSDDADVLGTRMTSGMGQANTGVRLTLDQLPLKRYKHRSGTTFSPQWVPDRVAEKIKRIDPDVINLHWANAGFVQIETLARLRKPIVWTLHDMWAFTGGCHYNQACDSPQERLCQRYQTGCGSCPQLGSQKKRDLSSWIWQRKRKTFSKLDLTIVTPSVWLAKCAAASALLGDFRVQAIPNGIDPNVYRPMGKQMARAALGLPSDKKLLLFGSLNATSDARKGFQFLQAALRELSDSGEGAAFELAIFGASKPSSPPDLGFKTHYLGSFSDDLSLALVFSAADAFVLPSLQENLANTVMEALACGTPCLAFNIGGMPDMIEHGQNGYLAQPFDVGDLARGIVTLLDGNGASAVDGDESPAENRRSRNARESVLSRFTLAQQADRYHALFREVC